MNARIHALAGRPQHYDWGGKDFIAALVGEPAGRDPLAEWWLGAHPKAPSLLLADDDPVALDAAIARDPVRLLGEDVAGRFGRLPFLLKVLDVDSMLSIQVHPDKGQAEAGFARETSQGVPLRSYADDNHKPEMMVALSRFHLLHGFRPEGAICLHLAAHDATHDLARLVASRGLREGYSFVMNMTPREVARRIEPIVAGLHAWPALDAEVPEYWLARAVERAGSSSDAGLFAFFFLNLVVLEPGQAMYQPARLPHAYLHGQNIELMASSDNVLRAGLTPKHVDTAELLKVLDYCPGRPRLFEPRREGRAIKRYVAECDDFALDDISLDPDESLALSAQGPEILFALDGEATLRCGRGFLALPRGRSAFVEAGSDYRVFGEKGTRLFRAFCGTVGG